MTDETPDLSALSAAGAHREMLKGAWPPPRASYYSDKGALQPANLARLIHARWPVALVEQGENQHLRFYVDGVYRELTGFLQATIVEVMDNGYVPAVVEVVKDILESLCVLQGRFIRDVYPDGLVNVRNGMLDVRTGMLTEHSPEYLGSVQLPVDYLPDATCPNYLAWAKKQIGRQLEDLEESCSMFLAGPDCPLPKPTVMIYGESRSGKGTWNRVIEAIVGKSNRSSLTLHQITGNRFSAAEVHNKILNSAGDIASTHIEDTSVWKMMTGEDDISAERKRGHPFTFRNTAMFLFSGNEPSSVSEISRAYLNRNRPFFLDNTFAGKEDRSIEDRIMAELPGIFARLVAAHRRMLARGAFLPTDPAVAERFRIASNRVAAWVHEECVIWPEEPGGQSAGCWTGKKELFAAFMDETRLARGSGMNRATFNRQLAQVPGVAFDVINKGRVRGWNVTIRPEGGVSGEPAPFDDEEEAEVRTVRPVRRRHRPQSRRPAGAP